MRLAKRVLYEDLAGGGSLARPARELDPCDCYPGKVYFAFGTNKKVGFQLFFFDPDAGVYYLGRRQLTKEEGARVERSSSPKYWINPRYLEADGRIRGAISGYEWCDVCEREKRAKLGRVTFTYWITTPSLRRTYRFRFGPSVDPRMEHTFIGLRQFFPPANDREMTEHLIFCLLFFGEHSSVERRSERALAQRFRVSRGRIRSIRRRFMRRLPEIAVRLKALANT